MRHEATIQSARTRQRRGRIIEKLNVGASAGQVLNVAVCSKLAASSARSCAGKQIVQSFSRQCHDIDFSGELKNPSWEVVGIPRLSIAQLGSGAIGRARAARRTGPARERSW